MEFVLMISDSKALCVVPVSRHQRRELFDIFFFHQINLTLLNVLIISIGGNLGSLTSKLCKTTNIITSKGNLEDDCSMYFSQSSNSGGLSTGPFFAASLSSCSCE